MSYNLNQQLNCQSCNSLRINAGTLCDLTQALQSLQMIVANIQPLIRVLQPLTNNLQRFSSEFTPTFVNDNDGIESDPEDNGTVELGVTDSPYRSTDRIASTMFDCPHPDCCKQSTYGKSSSLARHFGEHIECDEKCLLCGASSTTVRTWLTHFAKCNNKTGNPRLSDALTRKKEIVKNRKLELDNACQNKMKASDKIDGNGGGKRKAEAAGLPPQRQQFSIGSIDLKSNTKHRSVAMVESKATACDDNHQWNGYSNQFSFSDGHISGIPIESNSVVPEDWGNTQLMAPYASEQSLHDFNNAHLS
ncbi:hypothetical protein PtrSN002B_007983 [Pyrenophora tritici-repentis]|nr:hypothetical protein A1F94_006687 [Pyrenophora tritici-repentis]KAI1533007.1 hypothetical protein PtrSN001C_007762 [Pyrenophora tritici-repentis]KAI1543034.1 hypothetical protein PtrSN002B_007983 [Pyrenophora tritici-repentis]KAI1593490.1 hypothetical protein PtrEW13061_003030 [Pyrenophora tritici-repentis]